MLQRVMGRAGSGKTGYMLFQLKNIYKGRPLLVHCS